MKRKTAFIGIAFLSAIALNAGTNKNPVLTNTFITSSGKLIVADTWNELKKTDISIEDLNAMMKEVKEQKKLIEDLKKQNKELKKEQDNLKIKLVETERKIQKK